MEITSLSPDPASDAALAALSFEDALRELESIVRKLEGGDAPLDASIALYTRGEALRTVCTQRLKDAEARIQKLTIDPSGTPAGAHPFGAE